MFFRLAVKSLLNRKGSVVLTICAITLSILVMLGVNHIKVQAKQSFNHTVSGVDLIIGGRTSSLNLLLYSVFRLGSPTNNISWAAFQHIKTDKKTAWAIPISLGDSHKNYRVLGTTSDYFKHFKYANKQALKFNGGKQFIHVFDVVIGYEVARALDYKLGDKLTLAHGLVSTSFSEHSNKPFTVTGILKPTGTPVDQTLHISLQGLDALHSSPLMASSYKVNSAKNNKVIDQAYSPKDITAFMVGLQSKMTIFALQRSINTNKNEPLLAILPGVALAELWQTISMLEGALSLISLLVFISAILGLSAMLLSSIKERNQEIQLLRTIGATPQFLYGFIKLEAMLITFISTFIAMIFLYSGLTLSTNYLLNHYGVFINNSLLTMSNIKCLMLVFLCAFIAASPASFMAYKRGQQ